MEAANSSCLGRMGTAGRVGKEFQLIVEAFDHQLGVDERLGEVLRRLRQARGWSLTYVAEVCATSGANISRMERGLAREYSLQLLSSLAAAFGTNLRDLFASVEGIDAPHIAQELAERDLLDAYRSMPPAQRETLMSVAMALRPPWQTS